MKTKTLKFSDLRCLRAGAILVYLIGGLIWSTHSRAGDEFRGTVVAMLAPTLLPVAAREQPLRLPALKTGGITSGQVLLITDSGAERINFAALAQRQMRLPSPLPEICSVH